MGSGVDNFPIGNSGAAVALAGALRELANAAYNDPDAAWSDPQTLVRDALRAAAVHSITPAAVKRALAKHHEQHVVVAIAPGIQENHQEPVLDRWMLELLTAALTTRVEQPLPSSTPVTSATPASEPSLPPNSISVIDITNTTSISRTDIVGPSSAPIQGAAIISCHLCGAAVMAGLEFGEDEIERHRKWHSRFAR